MPKKKSLPKVSAEEFQRKVAELTERAERAEKALSSYQDYVWTSMGKWMDKLNAGLTGHQPETWSIMDMAVQRLLALQDENAKLKEQVGKPIRRRLPDTRESIIHKFSVANHEGYITVGLFPEDKSPGEMFVVMAKEGSTVGGLMDTIGRLTSIALQSGVPLDALCDKFIGQRFEPSGYTTNSEIKIANSIIDYVYRWLKLTFCEAEVATQS